MPGPSSPRHLDTKTLDRIKRMDVRARLVVEGFLTGQHQSPYNGFAVEFATHREYAPGDDVRHIDWKVWSKTDRLYIKEYEEETNLKCHIFLDSSKSMKYGDVHGWSKFDHAATAAASLAYLLQQQQDIVGLHLFSNQWDASIRPASGPNHLKRLLQTLDEAVPAKETEVTDLFLELAGQMRQRGLVVLFSDLFLPEKDLRETLQRFRYRGHEVVVFQIMHEDELSFPFEGNTMFKGMEEPVQLFADPRSLRNSYLESMNRFLDRTRRTCASLGIDHVMVSTAEPLDAVLSRYLSFRQKIRRQPRN